MGKGLGDEGKRLQQYVLLFLADSERKEEEAITSGRVHLYRRGAERVLFRTPGAFAESPWDFGRTRELK